MEYTIYTSRTVISFNKVQHKPLSDMTVDLPSYTSEGYNLELH